ncbi:inorganic phosphate transporter [Nonomuraea typhae]|uniref:inorganic phosphate transporter n=1 Tax=Nonomuraea typhae TaxID=2603600 RepID=UPI001FE80FA0|nr:inorganic phosphate transporter [Nonomuraea typhae]
MPLDVVILGLVAGLFAIVSGLNDGGALLATGLKLPTVRPAVGILTLVAMLALIPLLTHQVALTFVTRLATFNAPGGRNATTVAVICSLAVVLALSARGLPTSLTLAVVGGLTGAGLGWGLPVSAGSVLLVLLFGILAPVAGGVAAWLVTPLLQRLAQTGGLPRWHRAGFLVQCVAYAANDGQKALAVFIIALGTAPGPGTTTLTAVLFGLGAMYGLPKAGRLLSREIIVSRPLHGVAAEFAAGGAVLASAAAGMPVSMTQAVAGALIGAGVTQGGGRVRWYAAVKIATAWLLTLPASALLAALTAWIVKAAVS